MKKETTKDTKKRIKPKYFVPFVFFVVKSTGEAIVCIDERVSFNLKRAKKKLNQKILRALRVLRGEINPGEVKIFAGIFPAGGGP